MQPDDLDEFGIRQYKKLRMTIKGHTVYKNINSFPAGHFFDGKYFLSYWNLEIFSKKPPSDENLKFLIEDSVKIRKGLTSLLVAI